MRRYALDGEPTTLDDFLAANVGELDAEEIRRAVGLEPGESMTFGGGAAAVFTLTRLTDAPDEHDLYRQVELATNALRRANDSNDLLKKKLAQARADMEHLAELAAAGAKKAVA